ncbi:hydrogenase maturation protease [Arhodomonas sp. AD133]|uniref:hydrogenase maturation protease n=1 Tax=Arhodomonas sp. AD133 TaxID=3415009 RepID=UPI003EBE0E0C
MTDGLRPRRLLGVGNRGRGDDAVGPIVAERLRPLVPGDVSVHECSGEATTLVELLTGARAAYIVDAAVSSTAAIGTVRRFDVRASPLPPLASGLSTHGLGLADALALARSLETMPAVCLVYVVEGRDFSPGAALSPPVARATEALAVRILDDITETMSEQTGGSHRGTATNRYSD